MNRLANLLAAALITCGSAAQAATVDFSTNFGRALQEGDAISAFDFGNGLTGSLQAFGGIGQALILDTRPGGRSVRNDPDLASPFRNVDDRSDVRGFGNALIVQENRRGGPDDAARGGRIVFSFDNPVDLLSVMLLDGEEGARVYADGRRVGARGRGGDNLFDVIETGGLANAILSFSVDFGGSGAIGAFTAAPVASVPLPATLPLALFMFGGTGVMMLRFRKTGA